MGVFEFGGRGGKVGRGWDRKGRGWDMIEKERKGMHSEMID